MKEVHGNTKLPYVYCLQCHKYQPADISTYIHNKYKFELEVISCGVCEIVQNLIRMPKMKYIKYSELKRKGWKVMEEKMEDGKKIIMKGRGGGKVVGIKSKIARMVREHLCWKCGKKKATEMVFGYPVCGDCEKRGIDPGVMEMMVIKGVAEGRLIPFDELEKRKDEYVKKRQK